MIDPKHFEQDYWSRYMASWGYDVWDCPPEPGDYKRAKGIAVSTDTELVQYKRQAWIHNNRVKMRGQPGRFMLNLYHNDEGFDAGFRYGWGLRVNEPEKKTVMWDMKFYNQVLKRPVQNHDSEIRLEQLKYVIEAVAVPTMAPLLIGIDWAREITVSLLEAAAESDD